jgi:SAM-dependent methyltransferase
MSEIWNKVCKSDNNFFGEEPSKFALLCFNHMKANNIKKVLELGAGHGRDTIFFASNGIEMDALDYSVVAIDILNKIAKEKRLPIKSQTFDVKDPIPFPDGYFDAVYCICFLICAFQKMSFILYSAYLTITLGRYVFSHYSLFYYLLVKAVIPPIIPSIKPIKKPPMPNKLTIDVTNIAIPHLPSLSGLL